MAAGRESRAGSAVREARSAKDALVMLRLDVRTKTRLEAAALARGQTLSEYAVEVLSGVAIEGQAGADPAAHFQVLCAAAQEGRPTGFLIVGQWLARHLPALQPPGVRTTVWWTQIRTLQTIAREGTPVAVMEWLLAHLPRLAVAIPHRRMPQLVVGLLKGFAEDDEAAPSG